MTDGCVTLTGLYLNEREGSSMGKWSGKIFVHKIKNKTLPWYKTILFKHICIFLMTLLLNSLLFANLYITFQSEMMQNMTETTLSRDKQIFDAFYAQIEDAEFYAWKLYSDTDLNLISDYWDSYDTLDRALKIEALQENIKWYRFVEWFITDINIFMLRNDIYLTQSYWAPMKDSHREEIDRYFEEARRIAADNGNIYLYVCSLTQGTAPEKIRFVCRITISSYEFRRLAQQIGNDQMAESMILINGDVLTSTIEDSEKADKIMEYYQSVDGDASEETFHIKVENDSYFCSRISNYDRSIEILTCRSYDDVFGKTKDMFQLVLWLIAANIVVFAIFIIYVQKFVRRPIFVLNKAFEKLQNEEEVQVEGNTNDEFSDLYRGFNHMSRKLTTNIKENYLTKIELQHEQLKQLQAQINPHFLYNTLLFIKIRIKRNDLESAEKLTVLLSNYYRFLNRDERDIILLKEEIGHICTYMGIQMERYGNRFQFVVRDYPEEWGNILVPRLLFQPLIENAVKYGVESIEEGGRIILYMTEKGNKVNLILEEEGNPITKEEVDIMNDHVHNPAQGEKVTSTVNINRRIQLYYGADHELRFDRTPTGCLRIIVELDGSKVVPNNNLCN